jgi:hypothetical protein
VLEVREAGIKVKGATPAGAIAQDDADTSGSGHVEVAVGIANQGAFRRGDPKPLAKTMHCPWIRFAGAVVRAPNALNQETELMMIKERLNSLFMVVTDNGAKDIVETQFM